MSRRLLVPVVILGLAAVLFTGGAVAFVNGPTKRLQAAPVGPRRGVAALQARLRAVPGDDGAWAALAMAYLEEAKAGADPAFYPKAEGALKRSLALRDEDNFAARAGMAALANARHDFSGARTWALQGLAINPSSAALHGALADAETQLGHYPEAFAATQRMLDISPDVASLSRGSYAWELRGDLTQARALMQRAFDDALAPGQQAFARYYLGDIALAAGDPAAALAHFQAGLDASPTSTALFEGRARAEMSLGRIDAAVRDLQTATERLPTPGYLLEYGELLESLGRRAEAEAQYRVFRAQQRLFEANGVTVDTEAALFEADHGDPARAVQVAAAAIRTRPFIEMQDAYAWALHRAGRDDEALAAVTAAMSLGTRNPLFEFHAGMIETALGHDDAARDHLTRALSTNSAFHPLHARTAQATLEALGRS